MATSRMGQDRLPSDEVDLDRRQAVLLETMHEAGKLALRWFSLGVAGTFSFKGPQDYLTEADGAVERLLAERLQGAFPEDGFLGEEGGGGAGSQLWIADPIDGTANFARGVPHFCISVGFVRDGVISLGAILNPATGDFYVARRGRGATLNGQPIRASATASLEQATVELGYSRRIPDGDYIALIARVLAAGASFRRTGSGALGIAAVADGRSDAYAELHINAWDCVAGLLLVEEAGGRVCPFLEGDGLLKGNPILVAAPGVAEAMAEVSGIRLAAQQA